MRWPLLIAFALSTGGAFAQPPYWEPHFISRTATVAFHATSVGLGKTLLLGDSNTEAFWWTTIGGCFVINAGMGGAGIHDLASRATYIADKTRPRTMHLLVGAANVGLADDDPDWLSMHDDLSAIVDAFQVYGAKIVLWPVAPVDAAHAASYPHAKRSAVNAIIQQVATEQGVFWDWWWPNQITIGPHVGGVVTNNYAVAGAMQSDGLHFSASTQVSRYNRLDAWRSYFASIGWACQ